MGLQRDSATSIDHCYWRERNGHRTRPNERSPADWFPETIAYDRFRRVRDLQVM